MNKDAFITALQEKYGRREAISIAGYIFDEWDLFKSCDTASRQLHLENALDRLLNGEPVQYIIRKSNFYGYWFQVDQNVLIPRAETEELVEWILSDLQPGEKYRILDVGTGSGCIAIVLKRKRPSAVVSGIDISPLALKMARINAGIHQVEVRFTLFDFLNKDDWSNLGKWDIIVSNPPYVPGEQAALVSESARSFEPGIAIYSRTSTDFYEHICEFVGTCQNPGTVIYVELNEFSADEISQLFGRHFRSVVVREDLQGKKRMLRAL